MPEEKKSNTANIILIIVLVLIVGVTVGVVAFNQNRNNTNNDTQKTEQKEAKTEDKKSEKSESPANALAPFVGVYTGSGRVLANAFQFPTTTYELKADNTFVMNAGGLDLAATQNPQLAINNVYPVASVNATGSAVPQSDGSVEMQITAFTLTYTVAGQPVPAEQSVQITQALATAFNVTFPQASSAAPLKIQTLVTATETGQITIANKPGQSSQVFVNFTGQKSQS